MKGVLWFAAGAGAGIYAMVRGRRAAEAFTADGLRDRLQALGAGARIFREEVAVGRAERETELRERYAAAYDPTPQLQASPDRADRTGPDQLTYERDEQ